MTNQFWNRWLREYLPTLNVMNKWQNDKRNLKIAEIVITDDNHPRNLGPKGRIVQAYPGRDGLVRVADVHPQFGTYQSSVAKICNL